MMEQVQSAVDQAIREGAFPGAAFAVGDATRVRFGVAGRHRYDDDSPLASQETLWDLASLSKVLGTTLVTMAKFQRGELDLELPIARAWPEFGTNGKGEITVRQVMTHQSGLAAFRPYYRTIKTPSELLAAIAAEPLTYPTGSKMVYSDLGMIALGRVLELQTNVSLSTLVQEDVVEPFGLSSLSYGPVRAGDRRRCAPTEPVEPWRRELRELRRGEGAGFDRDEEFIQGEVHDPTATVLGGRAGHAGLFASVADVATLAQGMLTGGDVFTPETIARFTNRESALSTRALGWDTKSPEGSSAGSKFGAKSFGHTGFTGTSVWIDPEAQRFAVLLSNRVHPTAENLKIAQFRPKFHDLAFSVEL